MSIFNRTSSAWGGVSYHLVLRNSANAPLGELRGIPRTYTEPGYGMVIKSKVEGVTCAEIAAVSVLYFGWYRTDNGYQVKLDPQEVGTEIQ